jgi:hypothetical protein
VIPKVEPESEIRNVGKEVDECMSSSGERLKDEVWRCDYHYST